MNSAKTTIKIAYLGGGSRGWAHMLMRDLALTPELDGEISLYDVDFPAAQRNERMGWHIFRAPNARTTFQVRAVRTLSEALTGADFVICSIEPGPTSLRKADLELPLRYGICQPVGDTTGPGGILRALRCLPMKIEMAQAIAEHCPRAWIINYTNPMTLCTAAFTCVDARLRCLGCCHEVFGTQEFLAGRVAAWFGVPTPDRREIVLDIVGLNHFTFATRATWQGHDLFPRLRQDMERPDFFADRTEESLRRRAAGDVFWGAKIMIYDFLRLFGAFGAAGERHLAEFVPWYLDSEATLHRWGIVLTPYSYREQRILQPPPDPESYADRPVAPSGEEGVDIMLALLGKRDLVTNVNVPNRGQSPRFPTGHVVETYARLTRDHLQPLVASPAPAGLQPHMDRVVHCQQLTLQAVLEKDADLAFQAFLADPLMRLPTDRARELFQEMCAATRAYLPF